MADWPYSTARWRRLRAMQLARQPLCSACMNDEGRAVPAVDVDHRVPISQGGEPWSMENLQSLCHAHHSIKTGFDMKGESFERWERRGCNPDGSPRDPQHPWHRRGINLCGAETRGPAAPSNTRISFSSYGRCADQVHGRKEACKAVRSRAVAVKHGAKPGCTALSRVIEFLQSLPITKGMRAGKKMRLLPDQVAFVRKVYRRRRADADRHRLRAEGQRKNRLGGGLGVVRVARS